MKWFLLMTASIFFINCGEKRVTYSQPQQGDSLGAEFSGADLMVTVDKMTQSLIEHPFSSRSDASKPPVLYIHRLTNDSLEQIDTDSITNSIRTKLLQSGHFHFVDMSQVAETLKQLEFQQGSGLVDAQTARVAGKQVGAEYMLYGNLNSITERTRRKKQIYYKININLLNIETGLIEWSDEQYFQKTYKRPVFGI